MKKGQVVKYVNPDLEARWGKSQFGGLAPKSVGIVHDPEPLPAEDYSAGRIAVRFCLSNEGVSCGVHYILPEELVLVNPVRGFLWNLRHPGLYLDARFDYYMRRTVEST